MKIYAESTYQWVTGTLPLWIGIVSAVAAIVAARYSAMANRAVNNVPKDQPPLVKKIDGFINDTAGRLIKLETLIEQNQGRLDRLERKMDYHIGQVREGERKS